MDDSYSERDLGQLSDESGVAPRTGTDDRRGAYLAAADEKRFYKKINTVFCSIIGNIEKIVCKVYIRRVSL